MHVFHLIWSVGHLYYEAMKYELEVVVQQVFSLSL